MYWLKQYIILLSNHNLFKLNLVNPIYTASICHKSTLRLHTKGAFTYFFGFGKSEKIQEAQGCLLTLGFQ